MSTLSSFITVVSVLALLFVPQALAIYFSTWRKTEREEFVPDGR